MEEKMEDGGSHREPYMQKNKKEINPRRIEGCEWAVASGGKATWASV